MGKTEEDGDPVIIEELMSFVYEHLPPDRKQVGMYVTLSLLADYTAHALESHKHIRVESGDRKIDALVTHVINALHAATRKREEFLILLEKMTVRIHKAARAETMVKISTKPSFFRIA